MTDQSPLDASLGGFISDAFRNRGRRGVLIGGAIAYTVLTVLITAGFIVMGLSALGDIMNWVNMAQQATPEMPPASVLTLIPLLFLYILIIYLVFAAWEAGSLRWLVRGETSEFLGLTFGADMWRVWFCYWMWLVVFLGIYIGCVVPIVVLTSVVAAATKNEPLAGALAIAVGVVVACIAVWICVRLAPATATTVALKRFAFFDAWKVTKGRFWVLFGALFLLAVIYAIASQVVQMVGFMAFMTPLYSMLATSSGTPDPEAVWDAFVAALASPATWIGAAVLIAGLCVVGAVFYLAYFGVIARAALVAKQEGRI